MPDNAGGADGPGVSRRALLRASGGAVAVPAIGTVGADGDRNEHDQHDQMFERCPDASLQPTMGHCTGTTMEGCADDHPVTTELQAAVRESLETQYPDVGALIDAGFKPYFDTLDVTSDDGWSHWLHPDFIGDDGIVDPDRPEAVLVDNDSWRSIGVMFIATRNGEPVEPPPPVYENDEAVWNEQPDGTVEDSHDGHDGDHDHDHRPDSETDHGTDAGQPGTDERCSPWHYHAGLPGRFAWWFYRQAYEHDFADSDLETPCRTPCMMHVWTVDHPDSVYAHDGPPPEYRDLAPADEPGFETDAEPGTDELGWDVLPDAVVPDQRPTDRSLLEFQR